MKPWLHNASGRSLLKRGLSQQHLLKNSKRLGDKSKSIQELSQPYLRRKHEALQSTFVNSGRDHLSSELEMSQQLNKAGGTPSMSHFESLTKLKKLAP